MFRHFTLFLSLILLITVQAVACLWDSDTLAQERSRFPSTLELMTGKFLRHSEVFYRWRIADRAQKLKSTPENLAYLDDLAVSHDKLNEHELAISVMRESLEQDPERYESLANLGTFLIHAGKLEEGQEHINKAIEMNPSAHFGRERYQSLLVQYVLSKQTIAGEQKLPLSKQLLTAMDASLPEFVQYVKDHYPAPDWDIDRDLPKLQTGIEGMLRFGHHDSPVLLEVLGEALLAGGHLQLASRAFLKAAYETDDDTAKEIYRERAAAALTMQHDKELNRTLSLEKLEQIFQGEIKEADAWFAKLEQQETEWCAPGSEVDPEVKFRKRYQQEPEIGGSDDTAQSEILMKSWHLKDQLEVFLIALILIITGLSLTRFLQRRFVNPV